MPVPHTPGEAVGACVGYQMQLIESYCTLQAMAAGPSEAVTGKKCHGRESERAREAGKRDMCLKAVAG